MLRFRHLQTPPDDGGILLEPPLEHWRALLEQNARLLSKIGGTLAGMAISEARQQVRSQLLGGAGHVRIIAAGHQPEFVHPGVWAKHVAVRAFAGAAGTAGIDFVVDNDAPRSADLRVPAPGDDELLAVREIPFTTAPAGAAYEGRAPLTAARIAQIRQELAVALKQQLNNWLVPAYLDGLAEWVGPGDAVDQHLAGRLRIDRELGADLPEHRVSAVVGGPFVADLLLNADRFAAAYNESLRAYRKEQEIRSPDRPLPDLGRASGRTETALWVYQPLQRRRRLWIEPKGDAIRCYAEESAIGDLSTADLTRDFATAAECLRPWVIRPRALTLTLWARLLACDLFVHGIGGAKYDRITDGIFRRYYGCEPPAYVCVSATLRSPWPMLHATIEDLLAARRRVRDWRFNPQRYCPDLPSSILREREQLIQRSGELRQAQGPRSERREVFNAIRAVNARLVESHPDVARALADRRDLLARQVESNRIAAGREYFYALQPRERLDMLADRVWQAVRLSKE